GLAEAAADLPQRFLEMPAQQRAGFPPQNRLAARAERSPGGDVIVAVPAVEGGKRRGLEHSAGNAQGLGLCTAAGEPDQRSDEENRGRARHRCRSAQEASVETSFQLGSRAPRSRAKVQTSVTLVTRSGLPLVTSPALLRVAEMRSEIKRTVIC